MLIAIILLTTFTLLLMDKLTNDNIRGINAEFSRHGTIR